MSFRNRIFHYKIYGFVEESLVEKVLQKMSKKTFYKPVMVAVSCQIQGGMMAQCKKLATAFNQYGKEKNAPVYFFAEDAVTNAGMGLLTSGDRAYASKLQQNSNNYIQDPYSIIGDFGFNYRRMGLEEFAKKWMFTKESFTTGKKKNRFDSFKDMSKEEEEWLQKYLNELEFELKKEVTQNRQHQFLELGLNQEQLEKEIFEPGLITAEKAQLYGQEVNYSDEVTNFDQILRSRYQNVKVKTIFDNSSQHGMQNMEQQSVIDLLAMRMQYPQQE